MPYVSRRADLLERSLQGLPSVDPAVRDLVGTVGQIPALTSRASAPRDEFVSALGLRLRAEALTLPAREVRAGSSATGSRAPHARRPFVLVIGRGLPRILAGAAASLLVVAAVVGGASRSALPGGLLYPVRALLDQVAVQLAGSDYDRGVTLLSQAQEHLSDVGALVERDGAQTDSVPVDQALLSAYDAVSEGQRLLLGEFDRTGNTQALIAVQDFAVRSLPQLSVLRPLVPEESRADVDALIALLLETRTTVARTIALCGQPCASLGGLGVASPPPSAGATGLTPGLPAGGIPVPGVPTVGGIPGPVLTTGVIGPDGVVVAPSLPIINSTADAIPLPGSVASITVSPPIVIPTVQTLQPLPLLTPTTALVPPATDLPTLP